MKRRLFIIFFLFLACPVFAQSGRAVTLAQNFEKAARTLDREKILEAYYEIKEFPEAVKLLKEQKPAYFLLYERYRLVEKVEALTPVEVSEGAQAQQQGATQIEIKSSPGSNSNQDRVKDLPNSQRRKNQERVNDFSNRDRLQGVKTPNSERAIKFSNQERAIRSPNQDRPSNSDRFR